MQPKKANDGKIHSRNYNAFFRQMLFVLFLLSVGLLLGIELSFFIGSALGAITLYIVFRKFLFRMTEQWNWPHWIAALALTLICSVLLAGVGYFTVWLILKQIPEIDLSNIVPQAQGLIDRVNKYVGFTVISDATIEKSGEWITAVLGRILNATYSFASNVLMMLILVYFMFAGGRRMECHAYQYAPFKGRSLNQLWAEFKGVVYSNAILIPLILVLQSGAAALIYWIAGMEGYLFWGFLTGLAGLIPVVGTMIVYVPISVYFFVQNEVWMGLIVLAYGLTVISNIDNLIRIILMKKVNDTHPLIVIFGVLIGIPMFGFWGIIFGPLLISTFLLLIRIYYVEYGLIGAREDAEKMVNLPSGQRKRRPESIGDLRAVKAWRSMRGSKPIPVSDKVEEDNSEESPELNPERECTPCDKVRPRKRKPKDDVIN